LRVENVLPKNIVIPDLIGDPTASSAFQKKAGSRIKSGMTKIHMRSPSLEREGLLNG
jgi:hypothetical protein